jgi:S1-C subfamily serine protease
VNAAGEVIGVNSSIYSPSGGSIGLGFAIPINRAKRVAEDLMEHRAVRQPYVGVSVARPATGTIGREVLTGGVTLRSVVPGSPADRAGLKAGDVITQSRGRPVRNHYDWEALLLDTRVGDTLPVVVRRGDARVPLTVTVADRPEVNAPKVQVLRELELVTLTPAIRAERGIQRARGALIYRVSDRVAEQLGVQAGDVIVQVNRTPVSSADEAARAIDYYSARGPVRMFLDRNGEVYPTDFVLQR